MTVIVACATCGTTYEATAAAVRAGAWRRCPTCHPCDTPSRRAGASESGGEAGRSEPDDAERAV